MFYGVYSVDIVLVVLFITPVSTFTGSCSNQNAITCDEQVGGCGHTRPSTRVSLSYSFSLDAAVNNNDLFVIVKLHGDVDWEMFNRTTGFEVNLKPLEKFSGKTFCLRYNISFNSTSFNLTDTQLWFYISALSNLNAITDYTIEVHSLPRSRKPRQNQSQMIAYTTPQKPTNFKQFMNITYETGISRIDISVTYPWNYTQLANIMYCMVQLSLDSAIDDVPAVANLDGELTTTNITKESENIDGYVNVTFTHLVPGVDYAIQVRCYSNNLTVDDSSQIQVIQQRNIAITVPSYADEINGTDIQITQHVKDGFIKLNLPVPPRSYLLSSIYNISIFDISNNRTIFAEPREPRLQEPDELRRGWMIGDINLGPSDIRDQLTPSAVYRLQVQPIGLEALCFEDEPSFEFCNNGTHCMRCESFTKNFNITDWGSNTNQSLKGDIQVVVISVATVGGLAVIVIAVLVFIYYQRRRTRSSFLMSDSSSHKSLTATFEVLTFLNKPFQVETNIALVKTAAQNSPEWFICEKLSEILITAYKDNVEIYDEDNIRKILDTNPRYIMIPLTRDLIRFDESQQEDYKYGNLLTELKNKDLLKLLHHSEYPQLFPRDSPQDVPIPLFVKLPYQSAPEQLTHDTDGRSQIYCVPSQFNEMICFIGGDPRQLQGEESRISILVNELNILLKDMSEGIEKNCQFYSNQTYSTEGQSLLTDAGGVTLLSEPNRSDSGHGHSIQEFSISEMLSDFTEFSESEVVSKDPQQQ